MGLCSSTQELDKVQQSELQAGRHTLEFLGIKWDSSEAAHLLKPFDRAVSNDRGLANVKRLISEPDSLNLPFEKYYYEGFLVFGNHPDGGHPTGHEHCTFPQYLVSLWNICTLQRPHGIAEWMFRMEFGDERASKEDVFEMFDKQYGISEARDHHAATAKAKYGAGYHKKQVKKTKAQIAAYQDRTDGCIHPNGFVKLIDKMPGMIQHCIAHQMTLREKFGGEHFWHKMDKKRGSDGDLESVDKFIKAIEILHPGELIEGGDGMHGIRGKSTDDGDGPALTHEQRAERKLLKHSDGKKGGGGSNYLHHSHEHDVHMKESKNDHTKHGDGKDNHGSKAKHKQEHDHHDKTLSMHERAEAAMAERKAHGDGPLRIRSHTHVKHEKHHGKKSAHDHGEGGDGGGDGGGHKKHHHKHKDKPERHSSHGRH